MKIKLSRTTLAKESEIVNLKGLENKLEASNHNFIYLDEDNDSKILKSIEKHFIKKSYYININLVIYGLTKEEHIYEMHIFK